MLDGRLRDYEAMERHAREALAYQAGNGTAAAALGLALSKQKRREEAVGALNERLAKDPLDLLCLEVLASLGVERPITRLTDPYQTALDLAEDAT
jgi:tetratricopeptide (TPR) repeat protein